MFRILKILSAHFYSHQLREGTSFLKIELYFVIIYKSTKLYMLPKKMKNFVVNLYIITKKKNFSRRDEKIGPVIL